MFCVISSKMGDNGKGWIMYISCTTDKDIIWKRHPAYMYGLRTKRTGDFGDQKCGEKKRSGPSGQKARYAQIRKDQMQDATYHLRSEATDLVPSPQTRPGAPARHGGPCPCDLVLLPIALRGQVQRPLKESST